MIGVLSSSSGGGRVSSGNGGGGSCRECYEPLLVRAAVAHILPMLASLLQNNVGFDVQGHCFYIEVRGAGC